MFKAFLILSSFFFSFSLLAQDNAKSDNVKSLEQNKKSSIEEVSSRKQLDLMVKIDKLAEERREIMNKGYLLKAYTFQKHPELAKYIHELEKQYNEQRLDSVKGSTVKTASFLTIDAALLGVGLALKKRFNSIGVIFWGTAMTASTMAAGHYALLIPDEIFVKELESMSKNELLALQVSMAEDARKINLQIEELEKTLFSSL